MTTVEVRIETVNGSMVTFSRVSENWVNLNQYERDDIISGWINEDKNSQAALSASDGYTMSYHVLAQE